jgi:hypothetical protein
MRRECLGAQPKKEQHMNSKTIFAGLALAGALAAVAAPAHAGGNVQWSVTIGAPGVVVHDTYWPYRPVVVAPRPGYGYGHSRGAWDRDRDGIPNRYDRVYNPRWDRDGDGVPNRYDRYNNLRRDRDGDGIPNWYDRRDNRR